MMIIDIYNALLNNFKDEEALYKFRYVDLEKFGIELKFIGKKVNLRGVHSRIIYDVFINDLQNQYTLKIKYSQSIFEYIY